MQLVDWLALLIPTAAVLYIGWRTQRYTKGVAGFLAGGRVAGRYVVAVASGEVALGLISVVALFEKYYQSGFAIGFWQKLVTPVGLIMTLTGFLINGYHRDTPKVLEQNWPVFSRGRFCQDSFVRTQVVDFRRMIEVGGVRVEPGDLVFGDLDGVVIVPAALVGDVVTKALEKARGEKVVRRAIEGGMSATDAFAKFGIL